jgi:hypothetical protein
MSKRREITDPRWDRVELPSLYRVLTRVHGEDEAMAHYDKAAETVLATGRYGEWLAVKTPLGQITGYRRANPKEWFYRMKDGRIEGPFPTKKLVLSCLRAKGATKIDAGVYAHGDTMLFTRDRAEAVNLTQEELL